MTKTDTKQGIIEVALEFFSQYGYDGTSIRDLAEKAHINVASINYHFGSKQNLYWATMKYSHDKFKENIKEFGKTSKTLNEMMEKTFNFVIEDPVMFRATMKMMMTDGVPDPDPEYYDDACEDGPPGMEYVAKMLSTGVEKKISNEDMAWAVRAIFGNLMHWCLIATTSKMELLRKAKKAPIDIHGIRRELALTTDAIYEKLLRGTK